MPSPRSRGPAPAPDRTLKEPPPLLDALSLLRRDGLFAPSLLLAGTALEIALRFVEALLINGLLDLGPNLAPGQRLGAMAAVLLLFGVALGLRFALNEGFLRAGRNFEVRLRALFLARIRELRHGGPQTPDLSDLAERCHNIHPLREAGLFASRVVRAVGALVATAAAITWVQPAAGPIAVLAVAASIGLPLAVRSVIAKSDLRVRTQAGKLSHFYLDALLGLVPCHTHGAGSALRREHESRLVRWVRASRELQNRSVAIRGLQSLVTFALAIWIVRLHLSGGHGAPGALLLLYWALAIPAQGGVLAMAAPQYAAHRSRVLRLLGPLADAGGASAESAAPSPPATDAADGDAAGAPAALCFDAVTVRLTGRTVLRDVDLSVEPGSHVAIIGPSGAGKTTLTRLLLGTGEHEVYSIVRNPTHEAALEELGATPIRC